MWTVFGRFAHADELSAISIRLDFGDRDPIRLANLGPRVDIVQRDTGVGDGCIAVDSWFIVDSSPAEVRPIRTAREVNHSKPDWVMSKAAQRIPEVAKARRDMRTLTVGLPDAGFEQGTYDLRVSPVLRIADALPRSAKARFLSGEPSTSSLPASLRDCAQVDMHTVVADAEAVVVLVAHNDRIAMAGALAVGMTAIDAVGLPER